MVCDLCGRRILRVRVNGVEQVLDGMQIASVKLDQKPWAQYLTGRLVLSYPHHDAMCTEEARKLHADRQQPQADSRRAELAEGEDKQAAEPAEDEAEAEADEANAVPI